MVSKGDNLSYIDFCSTFLYSATLKSVGYQYKVVFQCITKLLLKNNMAVMFSKCLGISGYSFNIYVLYIAAFVND